MNKRGDVHSEDWVGIVYQNDEDIVRMIIKIMDIKDEPEYIHDLKSWIHRDGIDEVYKKVIRMYSLRLT